jgi:hypothetical protein
VWGSEVTSTLFNVEFEYSFEVTFEIGLSREKTVMIDPSGADRGMTVLRQKVGEAAPRFMPIAKVHFFLDRERVEVDDPLFHSGDAMLHDGPFDRGIVVSESDSGGSGKES